MPKTLKFDFTNDQSETLSGRLEFPSNPPRAFAILAHCFTCSKDFIAASRISRQLSHLDIAVLRFDFTGLGNSQGDFANTNFSSNVDDLLSAYRALEKEYQAPEILIGHSLGGAAVLKASSELDKVKAVVTIGAPSDTEHVSKLFKDDVEKINKEGLAEVNLAGRQFTIKKQFLEDIKEHKILDSLKSSRKAFLIMHSPVDNTVSIDHASQIFLAIKHPKSFIGLNQADHLLTQPKDAEYAAKIISSWVEQFLETQEERPSTDSQIEVFSRPGFKFTQDIYSDKHHLVADEPPKVKGDDLGMDPYELLLSSLGACTAMTITMYAERKNIEIKNLQVKLNHEKKHVDDCNDCTEGKKKSVDHINKEILIQGDFTQEQHQRMLEIAERCPVNQTLLSEVRIQSEHGSKGES